MAEHDAMICRACSREEQASEGYPCAGCGTFICVVCSMQGVRYCLACQERLGAAAKQAT